MTPKGNGRDGRDAKGRFTAGNRGGPGNPYAQKVGKLRSALLSAVSETDVKAVIRALVTKAKKGDTAAAKILFERAFGPPIATDILERIEALEKKAGGGVTNG